MNLHDPKNPISVRMIWELGQINMKLDEIIRRLDDGE